jgi:fibronectin-binding autotransporter adhesin
MESRPRSTLMALSRASLSGLSLVTAVAAALSSAQSHSSAATFTWGGATGVWNAGASWVGGVAPTGSDFTDILIFGGPVGTPYLSTDNFATPFALNQIVLEATDSGASGAAHIIAADPGARIALGGTAPQILQNGTGGINFTAPIELRANTTFGGTGTGVVTLNGAVSGAYDITKTGTSTFRFGSIGGDAIPSDNTWSGTLNLQGGTIRFNNNLSTGRTALRSNPVITSAGTLLTATSEIRVGTLSGAGTVSTTVTGTNEDSSSIVVTALQDGIFSGSIAIAPPAGTGGADGSIVVRGANTQRFTGFMSVSRGDVVVGAGARMVMSDSASLAAETAGGVILNGGTFVLDNLSGANNSNRLRGSNFDTDSTGLETIGGGTFSLIGGTTGTQETVARLQLGSVNNAGTVSTPRAGALDINIVHNAAAAAATTLTFAAYTRNGITTSQFAQQFATVDFTAQDGSGNALALGQAGSNPRVLFGSSFVVPLSVAGASGLLTSTGGAADFGWATVNGSDFATYNATNGITAAATSNFPLSGTGAATTNYLLSGSHIIGNSVAFSAQSLKLAPSGTNQALTIGAGATLTTRGFVLGGDRDYSISSTTGSIVGTSSRYFHIDKATLNVSAAIGGTGALVKSGAGTLNLTSTNNAANNSMVVINQGQVRASTTTLPNGELRFRGGVLELTGGGTFTRPLGTGNGSVNWSGFDGVDPINQDRGSGGFAAIDADVTLDLGGAAQNNFAWEANSFVNSGHALIFGSRSATHRVDWVDNLSLTAVGTTNYNAREFRVIDNSDPLVTTDRLRVSGTISGSIYNDLLKTGDGVMELSGTNTYGGATIVHGGTLLVNGANSQSFLTRVVGGGRLGGVGTIRGARVESGGVLAPGELSGSTQTAQFELNGDLAFRSGSQFAIDLSVTGADRVKVNGGVTLDGAELAGSLLNGFIPAAMDLFFVIINDGADAVQGTFAQGNSVTFGGQIFEISYAGNFDTLAFEGGNDVVLRAVPEPSAGLLIGTAAVLLGGFRRRRAQRA